MQRVPSSLELTLKVKVKILHCKMQFNNYSQTQIDFSAIIRRIFFPNFKRIYCMQTVNILIRRRMMRRLIWVCTICTRPIKRTLSRIKLNSLKMREHRCLNCNNSLLQNSTTLICTKALSCRYITIKTVFTIGTSAFTNIKLYFTIYDHALCALPN